MRDRIPEPGKENRVRIVQDDGQVVEGVLEHADNAAIEGSSYNKANVLPDTVCDKFKINRTTAEPKDAFAACMTVPLTGKELPSDSTPGELGQFFIHQSELGVVKTLQCVYCNKSLGVYRWKVISTENMYQKITETLSPDKKSWQAPKNLVSAIPVKITAQGGSGGGGGGGTGGAAGVNTSYSGGNGGGGGGGGSGYPGQTVTKEIALKPLLYYSYSVGVAGVGGSRENGGEDGTAGTETTFYAGKVKALGGMGGKKGGYGLSGSDATASQRGEHGTGGAGGIGYINGTKGGNASNSSGGSGGAGGDNSAQEGGAGGSPGKNGTNAQDADHGGTGGGGGKGGQNQDYGYKGGAGGDGYPGSLKLEYYIVNSSLF